jgi:hypothetical protein
MKKILSFFLVLLGVANAAVFAMQDHSTHSGYSVMPDWMGQAQLTSANVTELVRTVEYATNSRNSGAEPEDVEIFQQDIDNYSLLYNWNNSEEGIADFILPSGTVISDKKQTKLNRIVNDQKSKTIDTISRPESLSNLTPEQVDVLLAHVYHDDYEWSENWENTVTNTIVNAFTFDSVFDRNVSCNVMGGLHRTFSQEFTASWSVTGTVGISAMLEFAAVIKANAGINVQTSSTLSGSTTQTIEITADSTVPPRTEVTIEAVVEEKTQSRKTETAGFYFACPCCPLHGDTEYTYTEGYNCVEGEACGYTSAGFITSSKNLPPCV